MNDNFCPAPWLSVYVDPAGTIENCCVSKNRLGNANIDSDVDKVVRLGKNFQIQQDMLSDKPVAGCSWCQGRSHTLRNRFFDLFPNTQDSLYDTAGNFKLRYLDLRWSNVCNYACVYCSPTLSSAWATELGEVHKIERDTKQELLAWVLDNIDNIEHIYMAGGEPTMMRENEIILKSLLERNPSCHVLINTNLSHAQGSAVFEISTQLPHCSWMVSVEDQKERYEYIRYPGNWEKFSRNLDLLQQRVGTHAVAFNMVFLNINAMTIWDTIDDLLQRGFSPGSITMALYNNGTMSGPWDMAHTSTQYREAVLNRMHQGQYQNLIGSKNIKDYLEDLPKQYDWQPMLDALGTLDRRRGLDSKKVFASVYHHVDI